MRPMGVKRMLLLMQRGQLFPEVLLEQHHQRRHFVARALPVLDREGVERHDAELEAGRGLDDLAYRGDAGAVPLDARQAARTRPAAVAVHDHRDVLREPFEVDLFEERLLDRTGLGELARGRSFRSGDVSTGSSSNTRPLCGSGPLCGVEVGFERSAQPVEVEAFRGRSRSASRRCAGPWSAESRPR